MKTIIIIVGSARSGSTLLAKTIGGHTQCFTLGEINKFNLEINDPETHCGCANKLNDCTFWNLIIKSLEQLTKTVIRGGNSAFQMSLFDGRLTVSNFFRLLPTILFKRPYKGLDVQKEIDNTFKLYHTVLDTSKSKVLIDSSKGLFRALALASNSDKNIQFKIIQLVRDGRGHLNSKLKTSYFADLGADGVMTKEKKVNTKNPLKVINSWLYINIRNFIILKLFNRKHSLFVKYEDFTSQPEMYLKKIYNSVDLEFEEAVLNLGEQSNHILGGNASRINAKRIKKQDDAWRKGLDSSILKKFNSRAGWFNKLLGYK